tara:strand:+ start:768 stop:1703 length:936 start_codon:yes stop_codon:yes gene_type:complete
MKYLFFLLLFSSISFSSPCDDPEKNAAYEFGLKIQKLVKDRDIVGLYDLVDGELSNGPRRNFAISKKLDQMFDEDWINLVLRKKPECNPAGWRGYMLGYGMIWYDKFDNGFKIFGINNARIQELEEIKGGWKVNNSNTVINPMCISIPSLSGDLYEVYANYHGVPSEEFTKNPGTFFGSNIKDFKSIEHDLCFDDEECSFSVAKRLTDCQTSNEEIIIDDDSIWKVSAEKESYFLLKKISQKICNSLTNIESSCKESYLVARGYETGGSMGMHIMYGIYGLFKNKGNSLSIVPLKFFYSKNEALDFLDEFN